MVRCFKFLRSVSGRALWVGSFVLSSTGLAQAFGIAPPQTDTSGWMAVRNEFEMSPSDFAMSQPVTRVIERLKEGADYTEILWLSYSAATPTDLPGLDEFWARYMSTRRDTTGFMTLMRVRAQMFGAADMDRQAYLENWLYRATGDAYDFGGTP